jgi:hypothetical protein
MYDFVIFLIAFFSSPHQETPTNAIKKIDKGKSFRCKTILIAFFCSPYREALNQRNKKVERKKRKTNPPGTPLPPRKIISPVDLLSHLLPLWWPQSPL